MFVKLRRPYQAEVMKNYIVWDFNTGNAEIVLHNKDLLPRCFEILIKRFSMKHRTEKL